MSGALRGDAALPWRDAIALARRDMAASLRGLRLLFICLFLGVATLAAIGSLTQALTGELSARGQVILGGDMEVALNQRQMTPQERAVLNDLGTVSETVRMQAMAQRGVPASDGPSAILTELKGVDRAYPLYGALETDPESASLTAETILITPALAERLAVKTGDTLRYGTASFTIAGLIAREPDRVGEGFTLGPVALVTMDGLARTGLIQPGSMFESKYRIRLAPGRDLDSLSQQLARDYRTAGWEIKTRERAAPGADRFFEQMGQFLSLIGLAALVIAGIGVSNGVSSYLGAKRSGIATFKVLGATSQDIARIYGMQIAMVTLAAIMLGLIVGALLPPVIVAFAGAMLPVQPGLTVHGLPLLTSAAYGILIALIFTLPPLARARTEPAAALFRTVNDRRRRTHWRTWAIIALAAGGVLAIALLTARTPLFSAAVLGATGGVLLLLLGLGWLIRWGAARLPRPRRPLLRLALTSLYRPGAQTPALVTALGLALTLFVTLAAIQTSLNAEIARVVPAKAPDQFVLDIPLDQKARFASMVEQAAPGAELNIVPTLRGTITAYGDTRVADLDELPEGAWFLRGERGVTYAESLPPGSDLLEGAWWPADYAGPPLVSLDVEAAEILNIGVGDSITVAVLGREFTARIASLRRVNWESMGFNYIMVFSPSTFAQAPHNLAATIQLPDKANASAVSRAVLSGFPNASIVDVGDVIGQASAILGQMSVAILIAASVAILAGIAVLIGAIAASRQTRSYDSVIMKTLGATRGQILGAQALEYGLLAAVLASLALALGLGAAWFVVVQIFEFGWAPDWVVVLATLAGGSVLTLGLGLAGSIPVMSVRPAQALRDL